MKIACLTAQDVCSYRILSAHSESDVCGPSDASKMIMDQLNQCVSWYQQKVGIAPSMSSHLVAIDDHFNTIYSVPFTCRKLHDIALVSIHGIGYCVNLLIPQIAEFFSFYSIVLYLHAVYIQPH